MMIFGKIITLLSYNSVIDTNLQNGLCKLIKNYELVRTGLCFQKQIFSVSWDASSRDCLQNDDDGNEGGHEDSPHHLLLCDTSPQA